MTKTNSKHQNTAGTPENIEVNTEQYQMCSILGPISSDE